MLVWRCVVLASWMVATPACSCSETTVHLEPFASLDAASDSAGADVEDGPDAPGDVTEADETDAADVSPTGLCHEVVVNLIVKCGVIAGPDDYGGLCARLSPEARACTFEPDCIDCLTLLDLHPECEQVCSFMESCSLEMGLFCDNWCPVMSTAVVECALDAVAIGDCSEMRDCFFLSIGGNDCESWCDMAMACGVVSDAPGCVDTCLATVADPAGAITRDCLATAEYLGDCEALAACGGL
jgi:hypothetical protein